MQVLREIGARAASLRLAGLVLQYIFCCTISMSTVLVAKSVIIAISWPWLDMFIRMWPLPT